MKVRTLLATVAFSAVTTSAYIKPYYSDYGDGIERKDVDLNGDGEISQEEHEAYLRGTLSDPDGVDLDGNGETTIREILLSPKNIEQTKDEFVNYLYKVANLNVALDKYRAANEHNEDWKEEEEENMTSFREEFLQDQDPNGANQRYVGEYRWTLYQKDIANVLYPNEDNDGFVDNKLVDQALKEIKEVMNKRDYIVHELNDVSLDFGGGEIQSQFFKQGILELERQEILNQARDIMERVFPEMRPDIIEIIMPVLIIAVFGFIFLYVIWRSCKLNPCQFPSYGEQVMPMPDAKPVVVKPVKQMTPTNMA